MTKPSCSEDRPLVLAVLSGEAQAWDRFVRRVADTVWTSCSILCRDEGEARKAFSEVMEALSADGFRRLRPYDGSSRIETFVALVARETLAERLMKAFTLSGPDEAWNAFEAFFKADIERTVRRRMPGRDMEDGRREAYQEICLGLLADGCRRIRAYGGSGSFTGYVLSIVDRLAVDFLRRELPRRRLPAAVARLGELEQAVFRAVHWESAPGSGEPLAEAVRAVSGMAPTVAEAERALLKVRNALPPSFDASQPESVPLDGLEDLPSGSPSPEEAFLEWEDGRILAEAARALRRASGELSDAERLYVRISLGGSEPLPAREVARLMGRPVEEVYKLKRKALAKLRGALEDDDAVKIWRASV